MRSNKNRFMRRAISDYFNAGSFKWMVLTSIFRICTFTLS